MLQCGCLFRCENGTQSHITAAGPQCLKNKSQKFQPVDPSIGKHLNAQKKKKELTGVNLGAVLSETRRGSIQKICLSFHQSSNELKFPFTAAHPANKMYTTTLLTPFTIFSIILLLTTLPSPALTSCRTSCGNIEIRYPFAVDDGCGAPQFRGMFNCTTIDLFFTTPSGTYKVQHIDYNKKTLEIYDPAMSTCSILQPHHDFLMTDLQSFIIPPTSDTVFALLNCSIDSPVLNHYKNLCFNFSGHSCDELYGACNAFRVFHLLTNTSPPCCFTGYDTVKYMSMNILDCTHYATVINTDNLKGIGPLDWTYGIKLSFSMPDTGCERCSVSGGTCGFDTETQGMLCLCSASTNATRECGVGSAMAGVGRSISKWRFFHVFVLVLCVLLVIAGLF